MGRTFINLSLVFEASAQINAAKSNVGAVKNSFYNTQNGIDNKIKNRANISNRLSHVQNQLNSIHTKIGKIHSTVESGANQYRNTDNSVESLRKQIKSDVTAKATAHSTSSKWADYFDSSDAQQVPRHVLNNAKIIDKYDFTSDFLDGRNHTFDALAAAFGSDWIDNALSLVGLSDDMNEKAVKRNIKSLIRTALNNKKKNRNYNDTVSTLSVDEFNTFKKIIDLYVESGKIYSIEETARLLEIDVREITNAEYFEYLSNQNNLNAFKKISNGLGKIDNVGDAANVLGRLFTDYSEDLVYLEAIKEALIDGGYDLEVVNDTVDFMIWEYENKMASALHMGIQEVAQEGTEKFLENSLQYMNWILEAKDTTNLITGLEGKTENLLSIYTTQHCSYALIAKYDFYANKIRNGDYAQSDIEKCNVYFELARNAKIQEYQAMINLYEEALESTEITFTSSIIDYATALTTSKEEIQGMKDMIDILETEVERLQSLNGNSVSSSSIRGR